MVRALLLFLLLPLLVTALDAQPSSIEIHSIERGPNDPFTALNREVTTLFLNALQFRGVKSEGLGLNLHIRAETHSTGAEQLIVMSVVEGHSLTEAVIEEGAKHQIWYAGSTRPENEEEARFVREYMTRDVLSNQVTVTNVEVLVFPESELERNINQYLGKLIERWNCQNPEDCGRH